MKLLVISYVKSIEKIELCTLLTRTMIHNIHRRT